MTSINGCLNGVVAPATSEHSLSPSRDKVERVVLTGLQMLSFIPRSTDLTRVATALMNQLSVGSDIFGPAPLLNTIFQRRNIEQLLSQFKLD
jgi:hypothetical protein